MVIAVFDLRRVGGSLIDRLRCWPCRSSGTLITNVGMRSRHSELMRIVSARSGHK